MAVESNMLDSLAVKFRPMARSIRRRRYRGRRDVRVRRTRKSRIESLECRRLLAFSPSGDEQEFLQLVNRFRNDPAGEYSRLISRTSPLRARDSTLQDDLDFAKVNGTTLRNELSALSSSPPLVWDALIAAFTEGHNQRIIDRGVHFHSNTTQRRNTLLNSGVNLRIVAGEKINSEVVYGYAKSVNHLFASYVIDWQAGGPGGMLAGRSHRAALHNPDYEHIGSEIRNYSGSSGSPPLGPHVNTAVLANIEAPSLHVTGAIFQDANSNGWYESGEGKSGVTFTFEDENGTQYTTKSMASGGYQIALPAGLYSATAKGGGLKYTQRKSNIRVGSTNVWRNWIYDPNTIPPDQLESNGSRSKATRLSSHPQSFSDLNIHNANDQDFFRLTSRGTGSANFQIQFSHSAGNLDMQLLAADGSVIANANSNSNNESIARGLVAGRNYYLKVFGRAGATNGSYSLTITPPEPLEPVAVADNATFLGNTQTITIDVLQNDSDPDGEHSSLVPTLASSSPNSFSVNASHQVVYQAPENFSGIERAHYFVTNGHGQQSALATIEVFVIDFSAATPWQNAPESTDVNDDGFVTALDALLVINAINQRNAAGATSQLPGSPATASGIFGFVDANGDGFLTAIDALMVINKANAGEGESADSYSSTATVLAAPFYPQTRDDRATDALSDEAQLLFELQQRPSSPQ